MEMADHIRINAPRGTVFAALNDPEILKQAIPGCEELTAVSPTEFTATVAARIGPLSAKFKGGVTLADIQAPVSYTLSGEGKGGPAGFAKVRATVELAEEGTGTMLSYRVKADIGGKLGQLGGSLIDRTAQKLAGEFFEKFESLVGLPQAEGDDTTVSSDASSASATSRFHLAWIVGAIISLLLAWYVLQP